MALNTKNAEGSTVITKEPDAEAYTNEIVDAALEQLGDADTVGDGFHAPDGDAQGGRRLPAIAGGGWRGSGGAVCPVPLPVEAQPA